MAYKTFVNSKAFAWTETLGIRITTLDETFGKMKLGLMIGSMNIVSVLYGLFSVKYVSIPLFLTFRRCAILATLIVEYVVKGETPNQTKVIASTLICLGAVVAGYESFNTDYFGYLLIWGNNFSQSIYNVFTAKYNGKKLLVPFEINFYFAAIGLPMSYAISCYQGEIWVLYDVIFNPLTREFNQAALVCFSGMSGILITICALMTVTVCGPIAMNISGSLKDVVLTMIGFALFDDANATPMLLAGLLISFIGAAYFTFKNVTRLMEPSTEKPKAKVQ